MSVDKLVDSTQLDSDLTSVANAIRTKGGTSAALAFPADFLTAIAAIPSGGSMGGLDEMVDVNSQDYQYAYMLMQMKKGETAGGTVTYTSAFTNTEQMILSTGLTALHGILFVAPSRDIRVAGGSAQSCKFLLITLNSDGTYNPVGQQSNSTSNIDGKGGYAQGTMYASVPTNGAFRFSGGDVYYTARYNKNGGYQALEANVQYEWLAW